MKTINLDDYEQQLTTKIHQLNDILNGFDHPPIEVFTSPAKHFRQRAEFRIWHDNKQLNYAMFEPHTKHPIYLDELPIASLHINQLMQKLKQNWHDEIISHKLFQAEFLTAKNTTDSLITLCYHKPLTDNWIQTTTALAAKLGTSIIGRSRKQKIIIGNDFVTEKFDLLNGNYIYQQPENSFSQPNADVCSHMLNWAIKTVGTQNADLLELYCGNGNFTLPLAKCFNKVLATEINKTSIKATHHNIINNQIDNITVARLSAEEMQEALNKERDFRRLQNINLDKYQFNTVLVDPPRAGLDEKTCKFVQDFAQILYISCNPITLQRDLQIIHETHLLTACALFDQFPFTKHIETGVLMTRKIVKK